MLGFFFFLNDFQDYGFVENAQAQTLESVGEVSSLEAGIQVSTQPAAGSALLASTARNSIKLPANGIYY